MSGEKSVVPVQVWLDSDGRIARADAAFAELQREAGGAADGPIALPALAALVRLGMRLGIMISRAVTVAHGDNDLSMWVQLRPQAEGFVLAITDWQTRTPRILPESLVSAVEADDHAELGWVWQTDTHLRFRTIDQDPAMLGHGLPRAGEPLTAFFQLEDAAEGDTALMPLIEGLAMREPFRNQSAHLRENPEVRYLLSGAPLFDTTGALMGYRGRAARVPAANKNQPFIAEPSGSQFNMFGPDLARRLDQALRQPIGRIIANASTISGQLQGPLRQDYADYAADIAAAGRHLLDLVDDLADLQAIERPGFTTAREEVDLADLARRAAGLLNVKASARNVRIQTPALGEQALASAEYRRVLQILVNVIGNAVRHSPEGSTIWVRVEAEDGRARAVIADQGSGIDPADHERIFERFERLGLSGGEGSGLGLYISRTLARAMNGELSVDSALGQGARFTLDLPSWAQG